MSAIKIARLADRGVVRIEGQDSEKLLQGLITNDVAGLELGAARHAALLSPQGKILFDFFIVRVAGGYLIDVARGKAQDLVKRISMYKLRADVTITDQSSDYVVFALWGEDEASLPGGITGIRFADPRHAGLGSRLLVPQEMAGAVQQAARDLEASQHVYDGLRVRLGIPEGGKDFDFGEAYPHEADLDLFYGVSFTKGCFVGQEIVSRMQNRTLVRKRVVKVDGSGPLTPGSDIRLGDVTIGRLGTVEGQSGLAMLRLDRALEAEDKREPLTAGNVTITPDPEPLARFRKAAAMKPPAVLPS